jgi:hypothetical protein
MLKTKLKTKFESKAKLKYNRNEKFDKKRNTIEIEILKATQN